MMRSRTVLILVAAVILVGVLAVAALRSVAPAPEATTPNDVAAPDPAAATGIESPAPASAAAAVEPPPPWASAPVDADAQAALAPSISEDDARREAQMAELRQTVSVMIDDALTRSTATSQHLRKALDTLEAMDDPAVKAQINLEALRHNLGISDRMQVVARELKSQLDNPPSPQRQQRIEALQRELATLQGQLRTDVARTGPAAQ